MTPKPKRLGVHIGREIGELVQDPGGMIRFVPSEAWVRSGQVPRLGVRFLEDPYVRGNGYLPHWFENLLPERDSRYREWLCKKTGIRKNDSMSLLAALGSDLPGAVEIYPKEEIADASRSNVGGSQRDNSALLGTLRFSLAGMQLKFSMLAAGQRFVWPSEGQSGDWIIKVAGDHFDELVEVEYATMSWAREIGLETPEFRQVPVELISKGESGLMKEARKAFAIKRFDRDGGKKIHQEDFAQVFGLSPADKYGPSPSPKVPAGAYRYAAMARLIRDVAGPDMVDEFVRRLAFVIASANDDAHLKNWSFQWGVSGKPRLSPCYDQVCTLAWPDIGYGWSQEKSPTLALPFGGVSRFDEITQSALQTFAKFVKDPNAVDLMRSTLKQCQAAWRKIGANAPDRMKQAIEEHWQRVPLLRSIGKLP